MKELLAVAGRRFLHTFGAAMLTLTIGILAAPNLDKAYAIGVAGLLSAVAAGIDALQEFAPKLSFGSLIPQPYGAWADAFVQAFAASLIVTLPGALNAPDLATGRSLGMAAIIGAFTAGARALEGMLTPGESPVSPVVVKKDPVSGRMKLALGNA